MPVDNLPRGFPASAAFFLNLLLGRRVPPCQVVAKLHPPMLS